MLGRRRPPPPRAPPARAPPPPDPPDPPTPRAGPPPHEPEHGRAYRRRPHDAEPRPQHPHGGHERAEILLGIGPHGGVAHNQRRSGPPIERPGIVDPQRIRRRPPPGGPAGVRLARVPSLPP